MKQCKECGELFEYTSNNQRYCPSCQTVVCHWCNKEFTNKNHHSEKKRFCSKGCYAEWQKENIIPPIRKGAKLTKPVWNKGKKDCGIVINCALCGKEKRVKKYQVVKSKRNFCSSKCTAHYYVGDGTKTPESKRLRRSKKYVEWRTAVFTRDNYTCQFCGVRGSELHPDHIKQWALYPELRFDVGNGRTLCAPCHRSTPTWGRRLIKKEFEA